MYKKKFLRTLRTIGLAYSIVAVGAICFVRSAHCADPYGADPRQRDAGVGAHQMVAVNRAEWDSDLVKLPWDVWMYVERHGWLRGDRNIGWKIGTGIPRLIGEFTEASWATPMVKLGVQVWLDGRYVVEKDKRTYAEWADLRKHHDKRTYKISLYRPDKTGYRSGEYEPEAILTWSQAQTYLPLRLGSADQEIAAQMEAKRQQAQDMMAAAANGAQFWSAFQPQ